MVSVESLSAKVVQLEVDVAILHQDSRRCKNEIIDILGQFGEQKQQLTDDVHKEIAGQKVAHQLLINDTGADITRMKQGLDSLTAQAVAET